MLPCPRCHRANPDEAAFCHFDGAELRSTATEADRATDGRLPREFVFPSGRCCRTYDDLVAACQDEWEVARVLLQEGNFAQFLAGAGRFDLVQAAQKAQAHADLDLGLHFFVSKLPATRIEAPRLDLSPRRLALGAMRAGEEREVELTVSNQGKGLLHGTVTVAMGGRWLGLPGSNSEGPLTLKTTREQKIALHVDTRHLAAAQSYLAKLTVITNGGIVEVPVSLDVAVVPFASPPFQGASHPRALAERMRADPKAAWPLLENGAVAGWFAANGWTYPAQGPVARGVAAVQQFFEAMGLASPPAVVLSDAQLHFTCVYPETVNGRVALRTPSRKWVYAQVHSSVPWLRVAEPRVSGPQQAAVEFDIDSSLLEPGQTHHGRLHLVANGGNEHDVQVVVDVRRPQVHFMRRLWHPFLVGAMAALLTRLALAAPADLYARVLARAVAPAAGDRLPPGSPAGWLRSLLVDVAPDTDAPAGSLQSWLDGPPGGNFVRHFVLATWWLGALGGGWLVGRRGGRGADVALGTIAGGILGVTAAATAACLLTLLDTFPRLVLQLLSGGTSSAAGGAWLWTPAWVLLAAMAWALLGGVAGLVLHAGGRPGQQLLAKLGEALARLFRVCGLDRLAAFLS
ncbi:MAG TPA: zinc ribbon domain-containing protein [Gemmataceae bacterium]|jgi:hypothetical protein|nr:zinc ribbon domain-containing protein [Gemmataceae bacterium]